MGRLLGRARDGLLALALGALGGASGLTLVGVAVAALVLVGLARSEWLMITLILSLPFDLFLAREVGGFTVRLTHVAALLLAFRLLLDRLSRRASSIRWLPSSLAAPLVLFLGVVGLGLFGTLSLKKSLAYFLWAMFDAGVLLAAVVSWVTTVRRATWVTSVFLWVQILVGVYGVVEVGAFLLLGVEMPFLAQKVHGWPRLNAFHYEPQYYAFFGIQAVAMLSLWWILGRAPVRRPLIGPALFFLVGTVFFSLSRSGWLALLILGIFALVRAPLLSMRRWALAGMALLVLATGAIASPTRFLNVLQRMGTGALDPSEPMSTAPRLKSLRYGWVIIQESPVLGVGTGNYGAHLYENVLARNLDEASRTTTWHAAVPANLWIELLAETGVAGTAAILVFLALLLWRMGCAARRAADTGLALLLRGYRLALVFTFFVMYQFAQTLYRLDTWFLISMCVALVLIAESSEPRSAPDAPERRTR